MSRTLVRNTFLFSFFLFSLTAFSQISEYFIIDNVIFEGNRRTKSLVIYNELDLLPGDTVYLSKFPKRKLLNEKRLLSTALFTAVEINIKNWNL